MKNYFQTVLLVSIYVSIKRFDLDPETFTRAEYNNGQIMQNVLQNTTEFMMNGPDIYVNSEVLSETLLKTLQSLSVDLEWEEDESREWRNDRSFLIELVDPHKYLYVHGVSCVETNSDVSFVWNATDPDSSEKFQLLPSLISVDSGSKTLSILSYINNLHPIKYNEMYRSIAQVLEVAIEQFGVLLKTDLKNQELQVIIGLKNIYLPPNTSFGGSQWHTEAMANEQIVASAIYYYDVDNIDNSELDFRVQGLNTIDFRPVIAETNRMVVFPNTYQHIVRTFGLKNSDKPGKRKILTMFLVDPIRRILSTKEVRPQQVTWSGEQNSTCTMTPEQARKYYDMVSQERDRRPGGPRKCSNHSGGRRD